MFRRSFRGVPRALGRGWGGRWMSTITSAWGVEVTSSSANAVPVFDNGVQEYLALSGNPVAKFEAAGEEDGGFVLSHVMGAFLRLLSFTEPTNSAAITRARRRAQKLVSMGHCTHRERVFVAALSAWAEGRRREAAALLEGWLLEQPVDVLCIRLLHDMYYFLGDAVQLRDSISRVIGAWETSMPGYFHVCGMFAFGAAENMQLNLAEEQAMRVLSEDMRDAWSLHALTHVYEMQGRRYEGQRLLRTSRWWWDEATLLQNHLHWHWALFQMEDGHFEKSAFRYDAWIREGGPGDALLVGDAANLLWRMELMGNHVYDRWEELLPHVRKLAKTRSWAYLDVLYAMTFAAADDSKSLDTLLDDMRAEAYSHGTFYAPAHTTSIQTPSDEECMVEDGEWWAGLQRKRGQEEEREEKREEKEEGSGGKELEVVVGDAVVKKGRAPGDAVAVVARNGESGLITDHVAVGVDPIGMEDVSEDMLMIQARPDFTFGPAGLDDKTHSVELGSAGGTGTRPLLATPFSTLPVLPLVAEEHEDSEEGEEGSGTHDDALVSLGGVGGLGLGSHSVLDNRYVLATVGVPLAEGLVAYREGDFEECVATLLPLRSLFPLLGASNPQRDVFEATLEAAATQSRQVLLARALLRERLTRRPNSGMANFHLSSVLYATGEHRLAGQARDRALRMGLGEGRKAASKTIGAIGAMQRASDDWEGRRKADS